MTHPERLAFDLELLLNAAEAPRSLTVCARGHLVVANNSHWQPDRLTFDLKSLVMTAVDHCPPADS